jgi:uncharacterized protein YciI
MNTRIRHAAALTVLWTLWSASLDVAAQVPQTPPPNMAAYYIGLLKRGAERSTGDKAADADLQAKHIASLERRWREGTLAGAGPVLDEGDVRGILIITAADLERARAVAEDDPAVRAGRLTVELHPWWGPKDIGAGYAAAKRAHPEARPAMRTYQLAFLRRGARWTAEQSPAVKAVQEGHMAHIREMAASGKLVAAGPFLDGGTLAGIFVLDATPEEARALANRDPAVQAGRLELEFHGWMAAEGVMPQGP